MKKLIFVFVVLLLGGKVAFSQNTLEISVSNIKSTEGYILVSLSVDENTFMKKSFRDGKVEAVQGQVKIIFKNLPDGEYAISVFHDANGNNELDSNFMGIPKEGFGFGNNASGMFGPPSFSESLIKVSGDMKTEVKLKHI